MIRFPALSMEKTLPGGIAVVALYSVTGRSLGPLVKTRAFGMTPPC